jgi:hypothetical protein
MASSMEHGKDLPSVQLLMKKNQVRQTLRVKKKKVPQSLPTLECWFFPKMLSNPRLQGFTFPYLKTVGSH